MKIKITIKIKIKINDFQIKDSFTYDHAVRST